MKRNMYRQGDVLLMQVEALPPTARPTEPEGTRIVLAYGEVTGHAHAVETSAARMYADKDIRFLEVGPDWAALVHEEHATIALKPGVYRIVHQREYVPQSSRLVAD